MPDIPSTPRTTNRLPHRAIFLAFWSLATCLLWGAPADALANGPTAASTNAPTGGMQFVLRPSDEKGNPVPGADYFKVTAHPGQTVQLYALVGNTSPKPVVVSVAPVDATTAANGGISYGQPSDPRQTVGSWVNLDGTTNLPIDPGKGAIVPFNLTVPSNAQPGEYVGGLSALVPTPMVTPVPGQNFTIHVQNRFVSTIQVTVPGPTHAALTVKGVTAVHQGNGVYLLTRIENSGGVLLKGHGTLVITKPGDTTPLVSGPINLPNSVPHTGIDYPIRWMDQPPLGTYHGHVEMTWDGGKTSWDGDFTVSGSARADQPTAAPTVYVAPLTPTTQHAPSRPWLPVALNLLLAATLAGGIVLVVRKRR